MANKGVAFQGPIPADGGGFILEPDEASGLLARSDADYSHVVRPFLTSEDIGLIPGPTASRYAIDFNQMSLEEAAAYPAALEIVRERVKPFRDRNRDKGFRERWWLFGRPPPGDAPQSFWAVAVPRGDASRNRPPFLLVRTASPGQRCDERVRVFRGLRDRGS